MASLKITHFWSNLLAWGYQHNFPIWGYQHIFGALVWYMSFYTIFWIIRLHWLLICIVTKRYKSMGVNPRHRAKAVIRFSELRAPSEDGDGGEPLMCQRGPKIANQAKADCSRLSVVNEQRASSELRLVWWV